MARNGSGTYSLPPGNPVVTGTVISSTVQNNTMNDIATALTQSIANNGVTPILANLIMSGYRHTGVGNAIALNNYASATDVQNGSLVTLAAVAGTDTLTAVAPLAMAAYVAGQQFQFAAVNNNTGPVTLNINGLGAKAITKSGVQPLAAGDIAADQIIHVTYDGTEFQYANAAASGASFFIGSASRNMTTAAGTQAITGVGFQPKAVILFAVVGGTNAVSWGVDNAAGAFCLYNQINDGALWNGNFTNSVFLYTGVTERQVAKIQSMDAGGFTLSWTKLGSPTGTADFGYLCMR